MLAQVKVAPGPGALLTWSDDLPQQQKPGCGGPGQRWPGSGPMTWPSFLLMENSSWASSPKELVQPTFFGRAGPLTAGQLATRWARASWPPGQRPNAVFLPPRGPGPSQPVEGRPPLFVGWPARASGGAGRLSSAPRGAPAPNRVPCSPQRARSPARATPRARSSRPGCAVLTRAVLRASQAIESEVEMQSSDT